MGEVKRKDWREIFGIGISQREWRGILVTSVYFETVVIVQMLAEGRKEESKRKRK